VQTRGEQFIAKRVQTILIGAPDGPPSSIHHHGDRALMPASLKNPEANSKNDF